MGEVELSRSKKALIIYSNIITYGDAANEELTEQIRKEIENMWNEPAAEVEVLHSFFNVRFHITSQLRKDITELEVLQNINPRNNYFRIEEFAHGNISFVDGLGCNTGYFKLENLYKGSTTAAHEYGHTLGLDHPYYLDIRGTGVPGIMYPRGTLVDPSFQYDPAKPAGVTGGTMHPMFRKVSAKDVQDLKLHRLEFKNNRAIIGDFTNIYHWNHAETGGEDFLHPAISG
ncbi:MAG TPA: hypothetical protein VNA26_01190 [Chitinophagaceae bacterium]|nr:hypothetical protein [Chitinophagaceae bacterium]